MSETRRQMIRDQLQSLTDDIQSILNNVKSRSLNRPQDYSTDLLLLKSKLEYAKNILCNHGKWSLVSVEEFYNHSTGGYRSITEMIDGLISLDNALRIHCLKNLEAIENSFKPKPAQQEEYHAGLWSGQKRDRM